jgi:hypothetical protein
VVTWRYWGALLVLSGAVMWHSWGASAAALRGGDVALFAALLAASGASDTALVEGIVDRVWER